MLILVPETICSALSKTLRGHGAVDGFRPAILKPWSTLGAIRESSSAGQPGSPVAVTWSEDVAVVRELIAKCAELPEDFQTAVIYADESVPKDLLTQFPNVLHRFLRRPLASDLFLLSSDSLSDRNSDLSVLDAHLTLGGQCLSLLNACNSLRCPAAGPANSSVDASTLLQAISSSLASSSTAGTSLTAGSVKERRSLPPADQRCLESGLLLFWDLLDDSHEISQTMEGKGSPRTADYWHGMMHRREPDAGNASYWFRRVGSHPAFKELSDRLTMWMSELGATEAQLLMARSKVLPRGVFDPFAMIEFSTSALRSSESEISRTYRMVQSLEILNLLAWTFRAPG